RVIGVLSPKGQSGWGQDQDDLVMIPFATAENKVLGAAAPSQVQTASNPLFPVPANPFGMQPRLTGKVNSIYVQARGVAFVPAAVDQVTELLQARHHIQPGNVNDFDVRNLSQIAQAREGSSRIMALLLAAVASISLLVGGIGIMNILLVSVIERTREIGIRMAIGARRVHVLLQFLTQAALLLAALISGCAVGPNFARPAAPDLTGYEAEPVSLPAPGDPDPVQRFAGGDIARGWWELFQSPALDEVLTLAVADSPTLVSARAT